MGLSDTVSQLILVKADTGPAKAELRSLRGMEKQHAKERLAELDAQNKGIDDQIARWGKIAAGVGAAVGVFKLAQAAANAYLEDLKLESAAAGINISRLERATRGLVETDNLLAFAGKTQHGVWKLNQAEMEIVAKGTDVLAKRMGMDLQPAMEKVTEAIQKGQGRALKELGQEVKDKTDLMRKMTAAAQDWGKAGATEGEKWVQAQTKLKNAWDDFQGAIGELVVSLTPLVSLVADLVGHVQRLVGLIPQMPALGGGKGEGFTSSSWKNIATLGMYGNAQLIGGLFGGGEQVGDDWVPWSQRGKGGAAAGPSIRDLILGGLPAAGSQGSPTVNAMRRLYRVAMDGVDRALAETAEEIEKLKRGGGGARRALAVDGGDPVAAIQALGGGAGILGRAIAGVAADPASRGMVRLDGSTSYQPYMKPQEIAALNDEISRSLEIAKQFERATLFEQIFGKPQVIDEFQAAIYTAAASFRLLEGAATAALDAFITGQQSMAEAVKSAIAQGLKAVAIDAAIQALKNTAYGFAALATGPIGGVSAGGFFKAAALFTGVAVAAGAGAKAAYSAGWAGGGGGYSHPSGTSAGGYIGGGGGGGDNRTSQTTIIVTGDAYRMSQAEREHRISDAARRGQQKRSRNVGAHE